MTDTLPSIVAVLGLIGLASVAAPRLRMPTPVFLAAAGLAWALAPFVGPPEIDAHMVLSVFLPPLLYADAWQASWRDFRRWLRPILSLAVGLVAFTTLSVGIAAKLLMPGLPWAVCFLIGAIVSPTDTVAVHATLSNLRVPRRYTSIIGGESLVNDATGLLGAQLALVVAATGVFEAGAIATEFVRIAGLGVATGVVVGLLAVAVNTRLRGTTVLFVFSLAAPYLAYTVAERLGASGVLAVVVAGFVASWRIDLIPPESRVDLYRDWEAVTFILNGLMFVFVGLEVPRSLGAHPMASFGPLGNGLAIAVVVVIARLAWFWPAAYIPLWLLPRLRAKEGGYPPPQAVLLGGWCGVRGAVSLAAALALPAALPGGEPFPGRTQIETIVLVTIVVTLVGQGWTLTPLARWLRLPSDPTSDGEIRGAREAILAAGVARLDAFCSEKSCPLAVYHYRAAMTDRLAELRALDDSERAKASRRIEISRSVRQAVWEAQSAELLRLRDGDSINDRTHQDLQLELDREHADLFSLAAHE